MAKDLEQPLTPAQLGLIRAQLSAATGSRRLDVILGVPNPGALVRALPADELYFTIREIGLADAVELVQLASAEQFRTFIDLDAWRHGQFEPRRALPWLRAARAGAPRDSRLASRLARKMRTLDQEVVYLVLRDAIRVHDLKVEEDPDVESDQAWRTSDRAYLVDFVVEGSDYVAIRGLLDDLEAEDPFMSSRLLGALAWELPSELEETALRWRQGRLADLGYPSQEEALSWYARPPTRPAGPSEAPGQPRRAPGFFLAPLGDRTLLARAAATLGDADREALDMQLVTAGNAVLVADGIDPVDLDQVRAAVTGARAMVELGLERLAGGDDAKAAEVLAGTPVKRLFQEGFGRVLELSWRADRLYKAGGAGRRSTPLLDAPLGELLAALSSRRPRFHPGIERPRDEWGSPNLAALEPRRFLGAGDLALAAAALDLCEGLAALARELGLTPSRAEGEAPRLSALYLTALANERLGRGFHPTPIPVRDLPAVAVALERIDDPRLTSRGEAGVLLQALARRQAEELAATSERAAATPELVTALLLRR
jgi:hypothetical protein